MTILVDTGAWYALADASDRHHHTADAFYSQTAGVRALVTTDLILSETCTLIGARLGRDAALRFWAALRDARIPILTLEDVDVDAAWRIVTEYPDQQFSVTDATSFAVMERLGIEEAFAFDAHFLVYRYGTGRRRAFRRVP